MTIRLLTVAAYCVLSWATTVPVQGQQLEEESDGEALFEVHCASCHAGAGDERAPRPEALRELSPDFIVIALTNGAMRLEGLRISATFRVFETIYRQVAEGILDAEALDLLFGRGTAGTPMFKDAWDRLKGSYSPGFRAFVEDRFDLARAPVVAGSAPPESHS